jgi:O-antigen/teichoic acid export membrane protein
MGIIIKQSIRSTIITYIGIAIGTLNVLWLYPKYFTPEQIGILRLLQDIPFLLSLFVRLGASNIIDRYFTYYRDDEKKHNGFLFIIIFYPLLSYIIFVSGFFLFQDYWKSLFAEKSILFTSYMVFIVPLTFFMMYLDIFEAYLRAHFQTFFSNFLKEVLIRIFISMTIIAFALKFLNFDSTILFYTLSYGTLLIIMILFIRNQKILFIKPDFSFFKNNKTKEILNYLLYIIPGAAGGIIAQKIDTLMIGAISGKNANEGLENVAIYSLAYFIGSVIEVPKKAITQISLPLLAIAFKENNTETINQLYKKNSLIQFLSGVFIFGLIWLNVDDLFLFVPNAEVYKAGKYVILLIGISKLFDMSTSINNEMIQFSKYFRFNLVAIILLGIVTIIMNLIFIPLYSIMGAALALVLTLFVFNIIKTIFIHFKMGIIPFSNKMIPALVLACTTLLIPFLLPYNSSNWQMAMYIIPFKSILFASVFIFIVRFFKISPELNTLMDNTIAYIRDYLKKI